tara:strand:- start:2536 stop:2703 length:168 start_codon:yes stop_codon:yes gene_type:complete
LDGFFVLAAAAFLAFFFAFALSALGFASGAALFIFDFLFALKALDIYFSRILYHK